MEGLEGRQMPWTVQAPTVNPKDNGTSYGTARTTRQQPTGRERRQKFGESGDAKGLYAKHGLDPAGIAASVKKFLNR